MRLLWIPAFMGMAHVTGDSFSKAPEQLRIFNKVWEHTKIVLPYFLLRWNKYAMHIVIYYME